MFYSILFPDKSRQAGLTQMPDYFKDVNLDQVVASVLKGQSEYALESFFYTPLKDAGTIVYRQDIMRDMEETELQKQIKQFAKTIFSTDKKIKDIQNHIGNPESLQNNYLTKGRFLHYAQQYCHAIGFMIDEISTKSLKSAGLAEFQDYLKDYAVSETFVSLSSQAEALKSRLGTVEYCMLINSGSIRVRKYEGQQDHSAQILQVFDKFKQSAAKDYRHELSEEPHAEHVEAAVLNLAATWYKDIFDELDRFCMQYKNFVDEKIALFSREVQFYIAYLEHMQYIRGFGLSFCYPKICTEKEQIKSTDGFDFALADSLLPQRMPVVNSFTLTPPEQIIVVTGPNQGGKTTFARLFGQLHHLGSIGCAVPGTEASLFLFDNIYTIFEQEEDVKTLSGKLQSDLLRLHEALGKAGPQSLMIINEIFSSTTLHDALWLGKKMMQAITDIGAFAVCVTFLDELASFGPKTVSMMSTVKENDPAERTYKIIRKEADGLAYAIHIAQKYGLTFDALKRRLQS